MIKSFKLIKSMLLVAVIVLPSISWSILALEGGTFSIQGGWEFPEKLGTIAPEQGYLLSTALGLKSGPLCYEGEFNYLNTKLKGLGKSMYVCSGMYNMYYDFESVGIDLIPFLAAGGGYAYVNGKVVADDKGSENDIIQHSLAFQIKVGLNYLISDTCSWTLGYRYFRTLDLPKFNDKPLLNHQLSAGVVWYIG